METNNEDTRELLRNRITQLEEENTLLKNAYRDSMLRIQTYLNHHEDYRDKQTHSFAIAYEANRVVTIYDVRDFIIRFFESEYHNKEFCETMQKLRENGEKWANDQRAKK